MADQIQIGDIAPRVRYMADGTTSLFSYPFPVFSVADLEVYIDGALQTPETDYAVAGAGMRAGGMVTFTEAPAENAAVTLVRRLTIKRVADFQTSGDFKAGTINDELDFQAIAMQQVNDDLVRSLRLSKTDADAELKLPGAAGRVNRTLFFDESGNVMAPAVVDVSAGPLISTWIPLADSASGDAGASIDVSAADHAHPRPSWTDIGIASVAEAEAGVDNACVMTPLRTAQAMSALGQPTDTAARDMAASALAYVMAVTDASSITGSVGRFRLVDGFAGDTLAVSTNATYDAGGAYYHNPTGDMTLEPASSTLEAADPTDVLAYVVIAPQEAVAPGSDIMLTISIDNGSTHATGTWTKVGDIGAGGEMIYRVDANMSSQSGSQLTYRLATANDKHIRFHDCIGLVAVY